MGFEAPTPSASPEFLSQRLARCGDKLPPEVRSDILALGAAVVPELIRLVEDDELAAEGSFGDGWLPIHAVDLLVDLKAEAAIQPMLEALARSEWDDILQSRIAVRLPELGPMVFSPGVALMETLEDPDARDTVCSVLVQLGVRDERVFGWCKESFERDPVIGATNFGYYGDERALPILRRAIEEFEPHWDSSLGMLGLADFIEAYEAIAGALPDDLSEHVRALQEEWQEQRELAAQAQKPQQPVAAPPKVGRNEPCPCGSGKKFKRCCAA